MWMDANFWKSNVKLNIIHSWYKNGNGILTYNVQTNIEII